VIDEVLVALEMARIDIGDLRKIGLGAVVEETLGFGEVGVLGNLLVFLEFEGSSGCEGKNLAEGGIPGGAGG